MSEETLWKPGVPLGRQRQPQRSGGERRDGRGPGQAQGLGQLRLRAFPPVHLHGSSTPAEDHQPAGFPWRPSPGSVLSYVREREQGHEGATGNVSGLRFLSF